MTTGTIDPGWETILQKAQHITSPLAQHIKVVEDAGKKPSSSHESDDVDVDMEAEESLPKDGNVYVAVKRIHTTSGPG